MMHWVDNLITGVRYFVNEWNPEGKVYCELCQKETKDLAPVTLEGQELVLCPACAATCHVGKWRAR